MSSSITRDESDLCEVCGQAKCDWDEYEDEDEYEEEDDDYSESSE